MWVVVNSSFSNQQSYFVYTGVAPEEEEPEEPEPPVEVGGDVSPTNKIALLAPWIGLTIVIIAGTTIAMRRRLIQS